MYLHRKRCTTLHSVRVCQSLRPKCTLVSWNQLEMQVRNCKMLSAASPLGCRLWFRRLHNLIDSDSDIFCKFDTTENSFDIPLVETEYMIDLCLHYALLIAFLIARHFEKLLICLTLLFFFLCLAKAPPTEKGPASRVSASVVKKIRDIGALSGARRGTDRCASIKIFHIETYRKI